MHPVRYRPRGKHDRERGHVCPRLGRRLVCWCRCGSNPALPRSPVPPLPPLSRPLPTLSSSPTVAVGQFVAATPGLGNSGLGFGKESREVAFSNGQRHIAQLAGALRLADHHQEAAQRLFMHAVHNNFVQGRRTQHVPQRDSNPQPSTFTPGALRRARSGLRRLDGRTPPAPGDRGVPLLRMST